MVKILVTGGTGLVGEALQRLTKDNKEHKFVFLGSQHCDLTNLFDTKSYFAFYQPDIVIHLASKVAGLNKNMDCNYEFLATNLKIHLSVVECCREYKVKKLINILSTCVFPDKTDYPLESSTIHDGPPHYSNEGYAYSKRILDILSKHSGLNVINLIPTNLYGYNDNYDTYSGHVIPALIHKMYLAKINGDTVFRVQGSGLAERQFMFADDFAKIILLAIDWDTGTSSASSSGTGSVIVSPDDSVTIKDLVTMIQSILQFKGDIVFNGSDKQDGQLKKSTNSKELQKYVLFNFEPLQSGLNKTIEYFTRTTNS